MRKGTFANEKKTETQEQRDTENAQIYLFFCLFCISSAVAASLPLSTNRNNRLHDTGGSNPNAAVRSKQPVE